MPKHDPYQMPKSFNVYLSEFLKLVVGGKYKQRRRDIFRDYLCASKPVSMPVEIDAILKRYEDEGMSEVWFTSIRTDFLIWRAQRRSEKASKASKRRWSQQRRKEATIKRLTKSFDKEDS